MGILYKSGIPSRYSRFLERVFANTPIKCIGAVCAPVLLLLVPSKDPRPNLPWTSFKRVKEIDMLGFVLLVGVFVTLLMGINFGGLIYPWRSGSIITLFVVAGVLSILFWIQQVSSFGTSRESRSFPIQFLVRDSHFLVLCFKENALGRNEGLLVVPPHRMIP